MSLQDFIKDKGTRGLEGFFSYYAKDKSVDNIMKDFKSQFETNFENLIQYTKNVNNEVGKAANIKGIAVGLTVVSILNEKCTEMREKIYNDMITIHDMEQFFEDKTPIK